MIKAIIVDDEKNGRDHLSKLISECQQDIKVMDSCESARSAFEAIELHSPDVVFLDVEMPHENGFDLLRKFDKVPFEVIFTTAYSHYAIKAFKFSAIDYLLKPIDINRLKKVVARLSKNEEEKNQLKSLRSLQSILERKPKNSIEVSKSGYKKRLSLDQVIAVEGQASYCKLHCADGEEFIRSENLKKFEITIDDTSFFRSHKSWLINKKFIESYSTSQLEVKLTNGLRIPISRYRKKEFIEFMSIITD